ncbi:ParB family protein [Yersinia enterocolitica]|uniref:ParB family protein n=1 Tax=Yersinia enterocolitica TaxID=630 RepID=UPI001C60CDE9|nr:ParB family protein [Yersinia enterocolitica]MBW5823235.1 ParB/RepB/Spo0J family partition protein [Yersinia enterocolitica]MBW5853050.1 ParB/RepB/Spo0J family partition protein [Yersinia enterocolitica]MBW5870479.1 ParB/RepB/Spo0J family partition protein [Yersinia enterocolitica]MBW5879047.1 ParB/RepB/Spo0J family partition protein [Yersinia enterocolitica]MBX9477433.1 ParB/RepB/Spo0J family partition protein [Yersinia enterocolitica]
MTKKRPTIGRTFSGSPLSNVSTDNYRQIFTLASGKKAVFMFETIPAEDIAERSFVSLATNGRDQAGVTEESLQDIIRTIRFQQFFPAIGRIIDGKIEILDGSRRRAAALICHVDLNVLVTQDDIDMDDARKLAADIQTAKEHNLREVGLRLLLLRDSGMNQKEIAQSERLSSAKVTRAIQAASVPEMMLELFPVQYELTYPDYKFLLDIDEQLRLRSLELQTFVDLVRKQIEKIPDANELVSDELKNEIIKSFRHVLDGILAKPEKQAAVVEKLWDFEEKDKYARKRIKGRAFSYEFNRLPKELQVELDRLILHTMKKHLSQ